MHSTSRCACLMFTCCPRQGWKLHPRAATGGGRHSPAPPQPHGYKSHTILLPPHIPTALGTVLHPSSAPHPSPIAPAPPWDPPNPTAELGIRLLQPLPLLLPQPPARDLFNPKLSSHKYTSSMAGNLLFLCFSPASQRAISSSSCSLRQPPVVSPRSSEIFQARGKICCSTKTLKLPVKAREAPQAAGQASGAAVPPDLPAYHQRFYYYYYYYSFLT